MSIQTKYWELLKLLQSIEYNKKIMELINTTMVQYVGTFECLLKHYKQKISH